MAPDVFGLRGHPLRPSLKRERSSHCACTDDCANSAPRVNSLSLNCLIVQGVPQWFLMYILDGSHVDLRLR